MTEDKLLRRQIPVIIVIGILFMIVGEPYMASCSAGFTAGLIAMIVGVIAAISNGNFVSVIPDIILVLGSGFAFNRFIRPLEKKPLKVTLCSVLFLFCKLISAGFGLYFERSNAIADLTAKTFDTPEAEQIALQELILKFDNEYLPAAVKSHLYEFALAAAFFVLFASLKFVVIDKKLAED